MIEGSKAYVIPRLIMLLTFLFFLDSFISIGYSAEYGDFKFKKLKHSLVKSPFMDGMALQLKTDGRTGYARYLIEGLNSGNRYSVSFMHKSVDRVKFQLFVYDRSNRNNEVLYYNQIFSTALAKFVDIPFTANGKNAELILKIEPNTEILLGHFGVPISGKMLYNGWFGGHHTSQDLVGLPAEFIGHRKFWINVEIHASNSVHKPKIRSITSVGGMNINSGLLPIINPGDNIINYRAKKAGKEAMLTLKINPLPQQYFSKIDVSYNRNAPADGEGFSRAIITAFDDNGNSLPGLYFRLIGPPEVYINQYMRSFSCMPSSLTTREYHLRSLVDGVYNIDIELWNGKEWIATGRSFPITFYNSSFKIKQNCNRNALKSVLNISAVSKVNNRDSDNSIYKMPLGVNGSAKINVHAASQPNYEWKVAGPLKRFRVFGDNQPDSSSMNAIASWIREKTKNVDGAGKREFAQLCLAREYAGLFTDNLIQMLYGGLQLRNACRALRKGYGTCGPQAKVVAALVLALGLDFRTQLTNGHVVTEAKGKSCSPMIMDSSLEITSFDSSGNLCKVALADSEDYTIDLNRTKTGHSPNGKLQTNSIKYYSKWNNRKKTWTNIENIPANIRNQLTGEVLSFDLESWEYIQWKNGNCPSTKLHFQKNYNQTYLEKISYLTSSDIFKESSIFKENIEYDQQLTSNAFGMIKIPFEVPAEIDHGYIYLNRTYGEGRILAYFVACPIHKSALVIP